MNVFKKCGLYVLSFALLSTVFSFAFSNNASAASAVSVDDLKIGSQRCDNIQDITYNHSLLYSEDTSSELHYSKARLANSAFKPTVDNFFRDFRNAGSSGYGILSANQTGGAANNDNYAVTFVVFDPLAEILAQNYGDVIIQSGTFRFVTIMYDGNCQLYVASLYEQGHQYGQVGGREISDRFIAASTKIFILASDQIIYINWQFPPIQTTLPTEATKRQIKPDFTWQVNNKKIATVPYPADLPEFTPEEGYTFNGYELEWSIFKCKDGGFNDVTGQCTNGSDHQTQAYKFQKADQPYEFEVSDYGDYTIKAAYNVQQCYRYPSYPSTPDYCFYSDLRAHFQDADFEFVSTEIHLKIDGRSFTGDTKALTCQVSGFCSPQAEICHEQPSFIQSLTCRANKAFNIGLLNPSILAFTNIFKSLTVPNNPTCNIPISNVQLMPGKIFPLSQYSQQACDRSAQFRNAFPIGPIVINFVFAITILVVTVRIINRLMDHKKNDVIEGI